MTPTKKARSRLQHSPELTRHVRSRLKKADLKLPKTLSEHWRFLPLLVLAGVLYIVLGWFLTHIRPNQISNWLLPNSFIPFHLLLFTANFFLFTFLTLSKRWGVLIALFIQWLLFLKLQGVTIDVWALISALIIGAIGWWTRMLIKKSVSV